MPDSTFCVAVGVPVGVDTELRERVRGQVPREPLRPGGRPAAVLVDGPAAEHLEILHGVPLGSRGVVEGLMYYSTGCAHAPHHVAKA